MKHLEGFRAYLAAYALGVLSVHGFDNTVAGELRILVDGEIELFVVDVVEFDARGRIGAIRA